MDDEASAVLSPARLEREWISLRRARLGARAPRYLILSAIAVLALLGLRQLLFPHGSAPSRAASVSVDRPAEDFALQFTRAYLSYDAARPEARQRALAAFLPEDLDPDAGFAPAVGRQRVIWAELACDQPSVAGGRVITVAAQTTAQAEPLYLAVTVRHRHGQALALGGYPAFVGAPSVDLQAATVERQPVSDRGLVEVAGRVVRNYLAGEAANLAADLTPDAVVTLPTVQLQVQTVDQVLWPGPPGSGAVLVNVEASDTQGASHRLSYELGIRMRERPYVDFVEVIPTGS